MSRLVDALRSARSGQKPRIGAQASRLALAGFIVLALLYFWNLDANLINDDEGSYLYAAWRISMGELPYRDFLTPQLPAFLMPGGWLMRLTGPQTWPLRAISALFTLATGLLTYLTARRLFGASVALIAGLGFALHPLSYDFGRLFRAEPSMLFFAAVGMYAFTRAVFPSPSPGSDDKPARSTALSLPGIPPEPQAQAPDRRWLAAAGLAFGLAILSKLFGALPLAGCGLWLLVDGLRRKRWVAMLIDGSILSAGAALSAGLPLLWFRSVSSNIEAAVLEHHLMQGADKTLLQDIGSTLEFYAQFVDIDQGGILIFAGIAVAVMAWRSRDRRVLVFGCQLFSLLGFVLLSRDLYVRHLMYLLPSLTTLVGVALVPLIVGAGSNAPREANDPSTADRNQLARSLALGLLAALILPWLYANTIVGMETESATGRMADFISLVTAPEDIVFGDFSELNFYAQRPTTYEGASMSAGAASSGQLAWSVVSRRFTESRPRLLVNLSASDHDVGHLAHMPDYADYLAWIETYYRPLGSFERDWQTYQLYEPADAPLPRLARFTDGPSLLAARPAASSVVAGQPVSVLTAWRNGPPEEPGTEYVATLRLVDPTGLEWAQWDTSLFAYPERKSPKWAPDELASQRIALTVPPDAAPGRYRLEIGMYRRNGDLVSQINDAGEPFWGRALAGTIEVTAQRARDIPEGAPAAERLDIPLGPRTLLGRGALPSEPVPAGATIPLDLWWRVDDAATIPHLLTGLGAITREPFLESYGLGNSHVSGVGLLQPPMAAIGPNDKVPFVYRQRVHVAIPLDTPPGPNTIHLADLEDLASAINLARINITSPGPSSATVPHPPDNGPFTYAALAGDLAFFDLAAHPESASPGANLELSLSWQALRRTETPWSLTVQLLDADGHPSVQLDTAAGGWDHPSNEWLAGERLRQTPTLSLPSDLPEGNYALILALYNPATGYRLPMSGPEAQGDLTRLGPVLVTAP